MTTATKRRRPPKAYHISDSEPMIGVVRCDEGDVDTFTRLSDALMRDRVDEYGDWVVEAPVWRWWRMNPCICGDEHTWDLSWADGPGHGNWLGAAVRIRYEGGTK